MEICSTARTQHDMTGPRKREGDKKGGRGGLDFSAVLHMHCSVAYMGNTVGEVDSFKEYPI